MTGAINSVDQMTTTIAVVAADSAQDRQESNTQQRVAEDLLKESTNYSNNSKAQAEEAQRYIQAANALEQAANLLRLKAEQMRKGEIEEERAIEEVKQAIGALGEEYQIPIPKDATPEILESMAKALEDRAKENRIKAEDLLIKSEENAKLAKQLQEQSELLSRKEMNLTDLQMKAAQAHNEGLRLVLTLLGIGQLDAEYKEQVVYSVKAEEEATRR